MKDLMEPKKQYLEWFLNTHRLKNPAAAEIINLLIYDESLLARVRFVDEVTGLSSALLVSAENSATEPLCMKIEGFFYNDIAEVLAALVNNPPGCIYLWLSYSKEFAEELISEDLIMRLEIELNTKFLDRESKKVNIMSEIDVALEQRDQEKFMYFTQLLKSL